MTEPSWPLNQPQHTPPRRRWHTHATWGVLVVLAFLVGAVLMTDTDAPFGSQREAFGAGYTSGETAGYRSGFAAAGRPVVTTDVPTTAPSESTAYEPADALTQGVRTIGRGPGEVPAGTYRTAGPTAGGPSCYWARLSGTGGTLDDIVANGRLSGPGVMTIRSGDEAVEFRGGCTWLRDDA